MGVGVLMEGLRITIISGEWIEAVEATVALVVVAGSQVLHLEVGVELFAAVEHVGGGWGSHIGGEEVCAVGVVVKTVGDCGV